MNELPQPRKSNEQHQDPDARAELVAQRDQAIAKGNVQRAINLTEQLEGVKPINTQENPFPPTAQVVDVVQLGLQRGDRVLSETFNPRHVYFMGDVAEHQAKMKSGNPFGRTALRGELASVQAKMASQMVGSFHLNEAGGFTVTTGEIILTGHGPVQEVNDYLQRAGYTQVPSYEATRDTGAVHPLPDVQQYLHNHPAPSPLHR